MLTRASGLKGFELDEHDHTLKLSCTETKMVWKTETSTTNWYCYLTIPGHLLANKIHYIFSETLMDLENLDSQGFYQAILQWNAVWPEHLKTLRNLELLNPRFIKVEEYEIKEYSYVHSVPLHNLKIMSDQWVIHCFLKLLYQKKVLTIQ